MDIKRLCVVGAGIMGHGIAQVAATSGFQVVLNDIDEKCLTRGMENIGTSLRRFVKAGRIQEEDVATIIGRISTTTDLEAAARDADFVIEAVTEKLDIKQEVFRRLDTVCRPEVILATNTSQLSITAIASVTSRRDKVIGTHWFSPPVMMRLIEIVRGLETSEETIQTTRDLAVKLGKETVLCKDSQGFITTRAINVFLNECVRIYEEGIASKEDIDKAIKLGFNHPIGPFEMLDMAGIDTNLLTESALCEAYGDRFRPTQTLRQLVAAGHCGRKSGRGFYDYTTDRK